MGLNFPQIIGGKQQKIFGNHHQSSFAFKSDTSIIVIPIFQEFIPLVKTPPKHGRRPISSPVTDHLPYLPPFLHLFEVTEVKCQDTTSLHLLLHLGRGKHLQEYLKDLADWGEGGVNQTSNAWKRVTRIHRVFLKTKNSSNNKNKSNMLPQNSTNLFPQNKKNKLETHKTNGVFSRFEGRGIDWCSTPSPCSFICSSFSGDPENVPF